MFNGTPSPWEVFEIVKPDGYDQAGRPRPVALVKVLLQEFPRFSYELGWYKNGRFTPHFTSQVDMSTVAEVASRAADLVARKTAEVAELERQAYMARRAQEDARVASKENKKANRTRNLERRRDEDRERTRLSKEGRAAK